jgi:hypothetical protein
LFFGVQQQQERDKTKVGLSFAGEKMTSRFNYSTVPSLVSHPSPTAPAWPTKAEIEMDGKTNRHFLSLL